MKKKWLIGLLGFLGIVLILLILLPIILKPKIEALLISSIDEQLDATFMADEVALNLFRHFPNASVRMDNARIITQAPFEGDTLFAAESAFIDLSLREVFRRGEGPRKIKSFEIDGAVLNLIVDEDGNANYDIIKEDSDSANLPGDERAMVFELDTYQIQNAAVHYSDEESGVSFAIEDIGHSGSGQFSSEQSELITETTAKLSLSGSGTNWFTDLPVRLQAILGIDLTTNTYTFKQNEAFLRGLPLTFTGSLQFLEEGQEWKLGLATPDSEFRNALALIPEQFSQIDKDFTAKGMFQVSGDIRGMLNEERIPEFDIHIRANDGFLQYSGMPKALEAIQMDMRIANETGKTSDTYVEIGDGAFAIGGDAVQLRAKIVDLLGQVNVDGQAQAALDLAQLKNAYPGASWADLKGKVNGRINARFSMEDVRKSQYESAQVSGDMELSGLVYQQGSGTPPINIEHAKLKFDPARTQVSELEGRMGNSDFTAIGTISNLLGYIFHDEIIKGTFDLRSQKLDLNEFLVEEGSTDSGNGSTGEKFEIPGFLDATIQAEAGTVYYDDLVLNDVKGDLIIRDKGVRLENAQSNFLGGTLRVDGVLDSSKDQPEFAMQLALQDNGIAELFEATSFFQKLAPIAQGLQGTMDSRFVIKGNFADGFELDFTSLSGQAQTELKALERILGETSLVRGLQEKLNFLESSEFDLKGLKTVLKFQDGRVEVSPFDFMYKDIAIQVRGGHTFDAAMDYSIVMEVPAYYLGDEVTGLIAQLNDPAMEKVPIPINVALRGNYDQPEITTDLSQSVTKLTSRLVTLQKEKALAKGKEEAKDLLGDIFGQEKDSATNESKPSLGGVVGDVFLGGVQQDSISDTSDSTATKTPSLQETATGILGGLLRKKKSDTISKDTIN